MLFPDAFKLNKKGARNGVTIIRSPDFLGVPASSTTIKGMITT